MQSESRSVREYACLHGYNVRYYRLSRLLLELTQARADGSYSQQLKQLAKTQLLTIDDWGLEPLKPAHRNDLMEIMDDRHGQTSTLVISQLPTDQWYAKITGKCQVYTIDISLIVSIIGISLTYILK